MKLLFPGIILTVLVSISSATPQSRPPRPPRPDELANSQRPTDVKRRPPPPPGAGKGSNGLFEAKIIGSAGGIREKTTQDGSGMITAKMIALLSN